LNKEKTVENMVLEIKDKSELMIDLAYSSILYDKKAIAEEVYDLEHLLDALYKNIQRKTLEQVKNKKLSVRDALTILHLAEAAEQIVELHPVIKMSLRESDVVFTRVEVKPESVLCGKTLGTLKLASETGMWVIAMRHGDKWLYGPTKKTRIDAGNVLFAKGPEDGEKNLIKLAKGQTDKL